MPHENLKTDVSASALESRFMAFRIEYDAEEK